MSLDNEEQSLPGSPHESESGSRKKSRISYTREFLLSFSNLNICKKLPSGFDASALSLFEDAVSSGAFERQRGLGGLSLHSKRGDYGAPQSRLEGSGNFSRGSSARWDTRSSDSSDKDVDLLPEGEPSVPDKHFGNQPRRFWQRTEHDGLLGSGAFARPTGYAGASGPKDRASGNYQLSKTTEPYQPPRPYKAPPFSRKDGSDSVNDETFGSAECASQDRAEEERKRRASFELMRKEQHKSLQEKQKKIPENEKENLGDDIMALLQSSVDKKNTANRSEKSDDVTVSSLSQNDASRPSFITPVPPSRPVVPPGFTYANVDKTSYVQPSSTSLESEARNATFEENCPVSGTENSQEKRSLSAATMDINRSEAKSASILNEEEAEQLVRPSLSSSGAVTSVQSADYMTTGPPKVIQVWGERAIDDCSNKKEPRSQITNPASQDHSTSILEKLFSTALSKNTGTLPTYDENQAPKADEETAATVDAESSKFAAWFLEEEKETVDLPPKDLLTLIATEKAVSVTSLSNERDPDHTSQGLPPENFDDALGFLLPPASTSVIGISEHHHHHQGDKPDTSPAILTCEDLEQFMLAEAEGSSSSVQHPAQSPWTLLDGKPKEQKVDVDNHASQHLLSLLQKGGKKEIPSSSSLQVGFFDKSVISDLHTGLNTVENATGSKSETGNSSDKSSTLEALFGAAFMNELHSLEAPVSLHRAAGDLYDNNIPISNGSPFSHEDNKFFPSRSDYYQSEKPNPGGQVAHLNHSQQRGKHNIPGPGLEYEGPPVQGSNPVGASFNDGALGVYLPEEESLITMSDSVNTLTPDLLPYANLNKPEHLPSGKTIEVLNDTLLNPISREEERKVGPDGLSHFLATHDLVGSHNPYHHLQGRPSSDIPHPMGHTRPTFPQLDYHNRNQQTKFIGPEGIHHDPHHPLANIIPHHALNRGVGPQFDPSGHHLMLQQMALPGNFPPQYPHQGLPRGGPLSHTIHQMPGYVPEMNNVHSILHSRQPALPGPAFRDDGGTHPEALQRLIEMELRAKSKHIHPAAVGHAPGIYGPEFNMNLNFRYG